MLFHKIQRIPDKQTLNIHPTWICINSFIDEDILRYQNTWRTNSISSLQHNTVRISGKKILLFTLRFRKNRLKSSYGTDFCCRWLFFCATQTDYWESARTKNPTRLRALWLGRLWKSSGFLLLIPEHIHSSQNTLSLLFSLYDFYFVNWDWPKIDQGIYQVWEYYCTYRKIILLLFYTSPSSSSSPSQICTLYKNSYNSAIFQVRSSKFCMVVGLDTSF